MDQTFMKERPIVPLVISMAIPMTISMLVNSLYNIIDSYYVARISEQAMTALSLVYPAQNLLIAVTVGYGIGMNAVIAYSLGAGLQKQANGVMVWNGKRCESNSYKEDDPEYLELLEILKEFE